MKKLAFTATITLLLSLFTFAQTTRAQGAAQNGAQPENAQLTGHNGFLWGAAYETVFDRIKTLAATGEANPPLEIIFEDPQKEIRIQRGGVIYRYLFYLEPQELTQRRMPASGGANQASNQTQAQPEMAEPEIGEPEMETEQQTPENGSNELSMEDIFAEMEADSNPTETPAETAPQPLAETPAPPASQTQEEQAGQQQAEAPRSKFFFMESTFPYLPSEQLYEKLAAKYGNRTAGVVNPQERGAYIWHLEQGYLIQWIDPYKQGKYTRSIYYISYEISEQIRSDYKEYMTLQEIKILDKFLP